MEELNFNKRVKTTANYVNRERREGKVPGIIYGKRIGNLMFEVGALALNKELSEVGEHGILNFNIDGRKGTAVIKEVQKDAVSQKVIHVDLEEINNYADMETEVMIKFIGKELIESKGGILQTQGNLVKVSCKPADLPKFIEFDVSNGEVGNVYTCADLKVGDKVKILDDSSTVIASITAKQREIEAIDEAHDKEKEQK